MGAGPAGGRLPRRHGHPHLLRGGPPHQVHLVHIIYKRISTFYTSLNYWEKDGAMIHANEHYAYTQEQGSPVYKVPAVKRLLCVQCVTTFPGRDEADNQASWGAALRQVHLRGQEPPRPDRRQHHAVR